MKLPGYIGAEGLFTFLLMNVFDGRCKASIAETLGKGGLIRAGTVAGQSLGSCSGERSRVLRGLEEAILAHVAVSSGFTQSCSGVTPDGAQGTSWC